MMAVSDFKGGPVRHIFADLGEHWDAVLKGAQSYEALRSAVVKYNDPDVSRFVAAVRRYAGVCSSGEYRLLLSVCALCDLGHLADDLSGGTAWQNITRGRDREYRAAIAACVQAAA